MCVTPAPCVHLPCCAHAYLVLVQTGHGGGTVQTRIEAQPGDLRIRLGDRFDLSEAARLAEAVVAFAPLSRLSVDFTHVREFSETAIVPLARTLGGLAHATVLLRGITRHQYRLLRYFGVVVCDCPKSEPLEDPHAHNDDATALPRAS